MLLTAFGLCKMSALNLAKITFGAIQVAYFELEQVHLFIQRTGLKMVQKLDIGHFTPSTPQW